MAYILDQDKLQQDQQGQAAQGNQPLADAATPLIGGGGSDVASAQQGAASSAGVGAGGTGGWTNIQSYLKANSGDTGSADALQSKVGGQFDSEKSAITTESDKLKSEAEKTAAPISEAEKSANDWLNEGSKAYDWEGKHGDAYSQNVGKLKGALSAEYTGPKAYAYGISDKTQNYGSTLGNDEAFNQFVGDMYAERAGGKLSTGGRALQTQLDVNNENLVNTRQKLLGDYSGLGDYVNKTTTETDAALGEAEKQFRVKQNSLRDYLSNTANTTNTTIAQQEADARAAYNKDYTGGQSGRSGEGYWANHLPTYARDMAGAAEARNMLNSQGLSAADLTWAQLQKEQELGNVFGGKIADMRSWDNNVELPANILADNRAALDQFYAQSDQKYANTADAEERKFNMLQEILGGTDKKAQGFKVRG
jgi:hypothetical protein